MPTNNALFGFNFGTAAVGGTMPDGSVITHIGYTGGGVVTAPPPPPPTTTHSPPPPTPVAPQIDPPSLAGQTWGHVIPITAGWRVVPGKPIEWQVTEGEDGHYILDTMVSFGWRAEIMGGESPAALFNSFRLVANGVIIYEPTAVISAPGVTFTLYDGTQLTADPFWEGIRGVGEQPAYIYHVLVNVVGLPLINFDDRRPEQWALHMEDAPVAGVTLQRWFELLGKLTRNLSGKVTTDVTIAEQVDSLFLVDPQTTFNRDALNMCRAFGLDMREELEGVSIVRGVNGTSFDIDEELTEDVILRDPRAAGITFARADEQDLPAEIIVQAIATEASFRFTERPARRELGPYPTTLSTKKESFRIQAGMPVNQIQTCAAETLYREIEGRSQARYKLPWSYAIKVQPGDIHEVPETAAGISHVMKVVNANREPNRTVSITARLLHTAQDYVGVADVGLIPESPIPVYTQPLELGGITPAIPGGQLFAPTFTLQDAVISIPNIASTAQLFAPTFVYDQDLTLGNITSTAQIFAPSILQPQSLTIGNITSTASIFDPTLEHVVDARYMEDGILRRLEDGIVRHLESESTGAVDYLYTEDDELRVLENDTTPRILESQGSEFELLEDGSYALLEDGDKEKLER
jgi:hypothetical protein